MKKLYKLLRSNNMQFTKYSSEHIHFIDKDIPKQIYNLKSIFSQKSCSKVNLSIMGLLFCLT